MLILCTVVGLIFFIAGGVGLFFTNFNLVSGSDLWVYGNITFGTFALSGLIMLIFTAILNVEYD